MVFPSHRPSASQDRSLMVCSALIFFITMALVRTEALTEKLRKLEGHLKIIISSSNKSLKYSVHLTFCERKKGNVFQNCF